MGLSCWHLVGGARKLDILQMRAEQLHKDLSPATRRPLHSVVEKPVYDAMNLEPPQSGLHKNTKHFFKLLICTELLRNAQSEHQGRG